MEYPFKDLKPLDEVTARTGYYRDWSHIDADTFHQISELVRFIREKGYGSDTREAIAQSLERVYHDAMKSGNANMEVSMARKHFKDLASRLNASDDMLLPTVSEISGAKRGYSTLAESLGNLSVDMINKNLGKLDQTFMTDEFLQQMSGNAPINAVPADESVTTQKLANSSVNLDKLDQSINNLFKTTKLENLVKNPTFDTNLYWTPVLATNVTTSDGILTFTATSAAGNMQQSVIDSAIAGHKYYISIEVEATSTSVGMLAYEQSSPPVYLRKDITKVNQFERISNVYTATGTGNRVQMRIVDYRSSGWTPTRTTKPVVTDLTETFGAGKEPTAIEYENLVKSLNNNSVFFVNPISQVLIKSEKLTELPSAETDNDKQMYVRIAHDKVDIISRYGDDNLYYRLGKKGVNQILDFIAIYKIASHGNLTTDFDMSYPFYTSSSDWFAPYIIRAISNANGDNINSQYFTGGNHGYDNTGTISGNTATGRTSEVKVFVDGEAQNNFEGYADKIEIQWTNRIQAYNTVRSDGSGREVLEEKHVMLFDGTEWNVKNNIIPLEDIVIERYYGLQAQKGPWNSKFRFLGAGNRKWNIGTLSADSSNNKATSIIAESSDRDVLEIYINPIIDLGKLELSENSYNAFASATKLYFYLIRGENPLEKDDIYTFEGSYKFYKV